MTKKKTLITTCIMVLLIGLQSCKKENSSNSPTPSSTPATAVNMREVKYEISGNFSGEINFTYSNESYGYNTVKVTSFPKSFNITYPSSIAGCTAGGSSTGLLSGLSGQKLSLKIYTGGSLSKTIEATADANGLIEFPNWGSIVF